MEHIGDFRQNLSVQATKVHLDSEHGQGAAKWHRRAVRPRGGDCVENVRDGDDPARRIDRLSPQSKGVAGTVQSLVVPLYHVGEPGQLRERSKNPRPDGGMRFHELVLILGKRPGPLQNLAGNHHLPKVVKQCADDAVVQGGARQAQPQSDPLAQRGHSLRMDQLLSVGTDRRHQHAPRAHPRGPDFGIQLPDRIPRHWNPLWEPSGPNWSEAGRIRLNPARSWHTKERFSPFSSS